MLLKRLLLIKMAEKEIIFTVEEAPEGGYTARALGYAIFTQGESLDDLREMVRDAVNCHFEKNEKPKLIRLHMVKDEVIVA
jgi:predicted RNase H-like HicB family nuclease